MSGQLCGHCLLLPVIDRSESSVTRFIDGAVRGIRHCEQHCIGGDVPSDGRVSCGPAAMMGRRGREPDVEEGGMDDNLGAAAEGRWRGAARSAFAITFDVDAEEVWIGADPANARRPGVLSQGTYGAKVGVPLILDLLDRVRLPATFFVPGRVAERHPDRVRQIVAAGHELAHHGYTHTHPGRMAPEQEAAEFAQALEVLSGFGADVVGYRSPAWDFSPATMDILRTHGLLYSSNLMDDIWPYRHPGGLVELPVQWILDDAPHFWFSNADWTTTIRSAREVLEIWQEEAEGIHRLGGLCVLALHPQLIGRPGRIGMLERFLRGVVDAGDVRIATCAEIAADVS
jgi:peptidoglycan/xylan/chitin deacetylase (PgdA/CDA1 family)